MRIPSSKFRRDRTPFIGRRQERGELFAELSRGTGLVTLTGPSGIGKTRLARKVAGDLSDSFHLEGGVWFCSLAECRDASDLEATVARTLGIQQQGDELARSIANRGPILLLLDNADPIASRMGGVIERWLERCVELQMIITSLVPIEIPGELLFELCPLDPNDAVALYRERAHRAWADRSFSGDETTEVQELVQRLDRLPLAIELAAARVRILPPRTMLSMFEKRFDLLRSSSTHGNGSLPLPQRRSSLFSALELTWSHLAPAEQLALARAAVFEGGFTVEAASVIVEMDAGDGAEFMEAGRRAVIEILDGLHRKSLLFHEDVEPPRYFLLESVKEYALGQLHRIGRWDDAIQRHARFFLGQVQPRPVWDHDSAGADSLQWLKSERENLIAIHQRFLQSNPSLAAAAGIALSPLLLTEGHPTSETELPRATLEAARQSGDPKLILAALEPVYLTHWRHGRFEDAKAAMEELAELSRAMGEKAVEAYTLSRLAFLYFGKRNFESSHPPLRRAVQLSRELGLPQLEGSILLVRGLEAFERNALDEAEAHFIRSVDSLRKDGRPGADMNALNGLSAVLDSQGKHLDARRVMLEVIDRGRTLGQRYNEAAFLSNLARMELNAGFLDEAEAAARQSLDIRREQGNRFLERVPLSYLGIISIERGDLERAAERLSEAEEVHAECSPGESRAEIPIFLAILEAKRGQRDEAQRLLNETRVCTLPGPMGFDDRLIEGVESMLEIIALRLLDQPVHEEMEEKVALARSRLAVLPRENVGWQGYFPVIRRLLEKELEELDTGSPPASRTSLRPLIVGSRHDWFRPPGEQPIDLRNRRILQPIFAALVKARLERPAVAVDPFELIDLTWPGIEMDLVKATKRLHMAILTLRNLGLRAVVLTVEAGYFLDPATPLLEENELQASAPLGPKLPTMSPMS